MLPPISTSLASINEPVETALDAICASGISLCSETAEYLTIAEMSPSPKDATIDFSLILDAVTKPEYAHLLKEAVAYASAQADSNLNKELVDSKKITMNTAMNHLLALLGGEFLRVIPGCVSLPLDPRLFVDTCSINTGVASSSLPLSASHSTSSLASTTCDSSYSPEDLASALARARALLAENDAFELPRTRVLIQIPATSLGLAIAHALKADAAHANMTLVGSVAQALACAQAGASVVSLTIGNPQIVRRVVSDFIGCGFMGKTEVMACGFSSPKDVMSLAPCDEESTPIETVGNVGMIALTPEMMKSLHEIPHLSATSASALDEVKDDRVLACILDGDTVASPLPEYFSSISGRTTVNYARALTEDHLYMRKLESALQKNSECSQMVEELLEAELDRVMTSQQMAKGSPRDALHEDNAVFEGDITSIQEGLEGLALPPDGAVSNGDGDSDPQSASTTDFEDVDLHTPLTNSSCTSQSGDAPTQDITDADDNHRTKELTPSAESLASGEGKVVPMSTDMSETTSTAVPIPQGEKPHMSVKARVMEIEARLEKDKEAGELIVESTSNVSVSA